MILMLYLHFLKHSIKCLGNICNTYYEQINFLNFFLKVNTYEQNTHPSPDKFSVTQNFPNKKLTACFREKNFIFYKIEKKHNPKK